MNANEEALYSLLERTNAPGYQMDPFLAAAALPQNQAPVIQTFTGQAADDERAKDIAAAQAAGRSDNMVMGGQPSPQAPTLSSAVPQGGQTLLSNLDSQLQQAQAATDSREAIKFLSLAEGSIAATKAEFQKEAESAAMAEYGIPSIQADIEKQRQIAQSNPYYVKLYGSADSDEVIQGEARLRAAKAGAEASALKRLQTNPTYAALMAKAELQKKLTEHHVMKLRGREDLADQEAESFIYSRPVEQQKLLYQALGVTDQDTRAASTSYKNLPAQRKGELNQLLQQGERAVPTLALSGNIFAERVAVDNEAKVFDSRDIALSKLKEVKAIASSDAAAATALAELSKDPAFLTSKTAEQQAVLKKYVMEAKTGTSGKEQQAEHAKIRTDIARWDAGVKSQAEFDSDLTKLQNNANLQVPSFLREAQADPHTGIITKDKAVELVHKAPNVQEKQRRAAELVAFYDAAVKKRADSFYFSVNPLAPEQLKARIGLFGASGDWLKRAGLPGLGERVETIKPPTGYYDSFTKSNAVSSGLRDYNGEQVTEAEYQRRYGEDYYKPLRGSK